MYPMNTVNRCIAPCRRPTVRGDGRRAVRTADPGAVGALNRYGGVGGMCASFFFKPGKHGIGGIP